MPTNEHPRDRHRRLARARVLAVLGGGDLDGMTVRQVASLARMGRTAATGWLIELYRDGLVRQREAQGTGGASLWQITGRGERQWFIARRELRDAGLTDVDVLVHVA